MLAKLAICAWGLYLSLDFQEGVQPAGFAKRINARLTAFQKSIFGPWAGLPSPAQDATSPTDGASQTDQTAPGAKVRLIAIEKSILDATNAERAQYGLPPLEVDDELMKTARDHCAWMTNNESLQHTHLPVAENIAMGQQSTEHVMRSWMGSSGHRANMLNGAYRRIGVAAYRTPRGTIFWCQQFRHH